MTKQPNLVVMICLSLAALVIAWALSGCTPLRASSVVEAREIPSPSAEFICFAFYQQPYAVDAFAASCVKR